MTVAFVVDINTMVQRKLFYLLNSFLLILPVLAWDALFTDRLPAAYQPAVFWKDVPAWLYYSENGLRFLLFFFLALTSFSAHTMKQRVGLSCYLIGMLLYFCAWMAQMSAPESNWSRGVVGFLAPAYTPLLWLTGIGMMGERYYFRIKYRLMNFIIVMLLFLICHNYHALLIYCRLR